MKKATTTPARTVRLGLVAVVFGLMASLSADVLKAESPMPDESNFYQQQQYAQLTKLDITERDSNAPKVSLHVENMLLIDVLHQLAGKLNVNISINTNRIDGKKVSYRQNDRYVFDVLNDLLAGTNLGVTLSDNQRTLIVYEEEPPVQKETAALQGTIAGQVTDADTGEPLVGVTVMIRGTGEGDATDIDGNFIIQNIPAGTYQLEISYVGYDTQIQAITVTDGQTSSIAIELAVSTSELDEVVVTAFGVERARRALGYSVQDVNAEDITRSGSNNLLNSLQGQVSGVQINRGGGGAGQGSQIFIRGFTSLDPNSDNQPLFVVDGVPIDNSTAESAGRVRGMSNRAIDLNPNDIESISVLKSAPATALYGVRAANGAVIITTKRGAPGDIQINFSHSISREDVINRPDYQDVYGPGFGSRAVFENAAGNQATDFAPDGFWPAWGPSWADIAENRNQITSILGLPNDYMPQYYNNWENSMRTGTGINNAINMSGGTETVTFFASVANTQSEGILPNNDWDRTSIRLSGELFNGPLTVAASANYINSGGSRVPFINFMERLAYYNVNYDVTDWRNDDGTHRGNGDNRNAVYDAHTNTYEDNVNRLIGNIRASYQFSEWFSLNYMLGIDTYADQRTEIEPGPLGLENELVWSSIGGFRREGRINNRDLTSNISATIQADLTEDFGITLNVGNDIFDRQTDNVRAYGSGFVVPDFSHFSNATNIDIYQRMTQRRLIGVYGDVNIDWRDIVYLNLTGRNDWSSTLPIENRSFFYPSVSLGVVLSDLFQMPDWVTYGKLRASYAEVGKDAPPYSTLGVYVAPAIYPINGQTGFTKGVTIPEPNLRPERTTSTEFGVDFRFLDNRLGLDLTVYQANSKDMIIPVPVSNATGHSQFRTNAGEIENKGFEITFRATPARSSEFQWDITSNFTVNRNEVVSIRDGVDAVFLGDIAAYVNRPFMQLIPGQSYGAIWGTSYQRYYAPGEEAADPLVLEKDRPLLIGEDGFPVIDTNTKIVGNALPDWTWNINNSFNYQNWDFSFNIDIVYGVEKYNKLDNWDGAFGHTAKTLNRNDYVVFEGFLADGTPNTQEVWLGIGPDPEGRRINPDTGEAWDYGVGYHRNRYRSSVENSTEDASYIKLRNINLGYSLSPELLENLPLRSVRAGVSANNILLWTPFSQYDPEAFVSSGSNLIGLVDLAYPGTRSLMFSLNFSF